jgi:nitrite reductase/ring-hydroxylating ferredoxin subunit
VALRVRVCDLQDIVEGELATFVVEGVDVPILVTRVKGEIIAGTSMCPHEDVSLANGVLKRGKIVCRGHGYAFDLKTGQCLHDPKLRWRLYKIHVVGSELFVELM